ncbi:3-deoxy-manno-octulosonate cytidylyltransferase [Thermodesulfobacteriota bacterium]
MNRSSAIIIPARYASSRFPGKPLAEILGKPMIIWVWEKCIEAIGQDHVYVATDDERIKRTCEKEGINVLMTGTDCLTGTDRVYDASTQIEADILINVQGDEPLVKPQDIKLVIKQAERFPDKVINAMCSIKEEKDFFSPTVPKVVARPDGRLLYMSRSGIPSNKQLEFVNAKKQVCIYAFPKKALADFYNQGSKTPLEKVEDIEILRFLEMGYDVLMIEVSDSSIAVDVPSDIERVEKVLENQ